MHPVHRWNCAEYGYKHDALTPWSYMRVLAIFQYGESAAVLEAALIFSWQNDCRCLNRAGGGESVLKQGSPFFVYVVVAAGPLTPKLPDR